MSESAFKKKFVEGPFKGLLFKMKPHPEKTDQVILEIAHYGREFTVARQDYNQWKEAEVA